MVIKCDPMSVLRVIAERSRDASGRAIQIDYLYLYLLLPTAKLICNIFIVCHVTFSKPKFALAHQISSKSDDPQRKCSDKTVRHLEFSKFAILVTWPVSEHDSIPTGQISC